MSLASFARLPSPGRFRHTVGAAGPEAQTIDRALSELRETRNRARSLEEHRKLVLRELGSSLAEASKPDWDGLGSIPVSRETYEHARTLIELLPTGMLPDDVGVDPDGEIHFRWDSGNDTLIISIDSDGRIAYAAIIGPTEKQGTEFVGQTLPIEIRESIRRVRR